MEQDLVLLKFNNKELDDLNPMITKGYSLILTETVLAEISFKSEEFIQEENLLLKIYTKKLKSGMQSMVLDILTDDDLFFHYRCEIDAEGFKTINAQQHLSTTFETFPTMLCKLVHEAMTKEANVYLTVMPEEYILLSFHKTVNFKQVNLISLKAPKPHDSICNELVAYRYSYLGTEIEKMNGRLLDVRDKLKVNPQLLLQFNKLCES